MKKFNNKILKWYEINYRKMPWRINPEQYKNGERPIPYHTWLSEVMLQQTNVTTVTPYFLKFIHRWKTLKSIAKAPMDEVLKEWAGLGYYARARNLKRCAETLVKDYNSAFPKTKNELMKLQGIGDYTGAAIAAIAFDEKVAVVDGNVERVMSRVQMLDEVKPALTEKCKEILQKEIDQGLKNGEAGNLAQGLMDLGATVCTPRNPKCDICPVMTECKAAMLGNVEEYPKKIKKRKMPTRKGAAFVITKNDGAVWLVKRKEKELLGSMSGVPTTKWSVKENGKVGKSALPFEAKWKKCGIVKHTFTHFHLELEVYQVLVRKNKKMKEENGWWSPPNNISKEALPSLMRKVLNQADANTVRR